MTSEEKSLEEAQVKLGLNVVHHFSLPEIYKSGSHTTRAAIPRRYEDTKPVKIQNVTHGNILGIGEFVNRNVAEKYEEEKSVALKEAEKAIWQKADLIKADAVAAALEKLRQKQEKELRQQLKIYERAVQEEALRVSLLLQKQAKDQLMQEIAAAEKQQKEAVTELQKACHLELLEAVDNVQTTEREKAAEIILKTKEDAAQVLSKTVDSMKRDTEKALTDLNAARQKEMQSAEKAHSAHMNAMMLELEEVQQALDEREAALRIEVALREATVAALHKEIEVANVKKSAVRRELLVTQADAQEFAEKRQLLSSVHRQEAKLLPSTRPSLTSIMKDNLAYQVCADM